MKLCSIKLKIFSARDLQTDGTSEVMNRVVEKYIPCCCEHKEKAWDMVLSAADFAYNSAITEDIGVSPFGADPAWRPREPLDILSGHQPLVQAVDDFQSQLRGAFEEKRCIHTKWQRQGTVLKLHIIRRSLLTGKETKFGFHVNCGGTNIHEEDHRQSVGQDGLDHLQC